MAQPMTNLGRPMKGAQSTFVRMQGPMPMMAPFHKASGERSLSTGMAKATVAAKNVRIIQTAMRLVCFTQTRCALGTSAKDMPPVKHPQRCVPQRLVICAWAIKTATMRRNSTASWQLCAPLSSSSPCAVTFDSSHLTNFGHTITAMTDASAMKMQPNKAGRRVFTNVNEPPPMLKRMLKSTSDRMSSTKAAVMMVWPKGWSSTRASCSSRRAMPTLVGAKAVPAATPSGKRGKP
mmetsp:Transcript_148896/g.361525  ORF Transcript_148896/g.361525 Transcript_148896/m.361525 type:complete len:235 (-) Transcript_148896:127-831(-)